MIQKDQRSLNISPDGKAVEVKYLDERTARVQFEAVFSDSYQLGMFKDHGDKIITSFKSKLARMGFDQFPLAGENKIDVDIVGDKAYYGSVIRHIYPDYFPKDGDIGEMLKRGDDIGKLYLQLAENQLQATQIRELLAKNLIKIRPGSQVLEDGVVRLSLNGDVLSPTDNITAGFMRNLFKGHVNRKDLWTYQLDHAVEQDGLSHHTLRRDGGLILLGQLFTRGYENVVGTPTHSDARVGDEHSNGFYPFEFTGQRLPKGVEQEIIRSVDISLYSPSFRKSFFGFGNYRNASNRTPEAELVKQIDTKSSFMLDKVKLKKIEEGIFEADGWPNSKETIDLAMMARDGKLRRLILNCDNEQYTYFPIAEEHNRIKDLIVSGVEVCWKNPKRNEIWHYNAGLFMPKKIIPRFNTLSKSRMAAAFYISAGDLSAEEKSHVANAMYGFKKFNGGDGIVYTGGGGGGMEFCNKTAQKKQLLSVGVCWDVPWEPVNDHLDASSNFGKYDITSRQDVIDKSVEVIIAGPGGFGTDLELNIANVNTKLRLHPHRPIILLGESNYRVFLDRITDILDRGRGGKSGQRILDNTYLSKDGSDVYDILCNHYGVNQDGSEIL
jgi:predicted Rossmann-fold nucleotide-binding protein